MRGSNSWVRRMLAGGILYTGILVLGISKGEEVERSDGGLTVVCEFIELGTGDWIDVMDRPAEAGGRGLRLAVQELVVAGKGKVLETLALAVRGEPDDQWPRVRSGLMYPYVQDYGWAGGIPKELEGLSRKPIEELAEEEEELLRAALGRETPSSDAVKYPGVDFTIGKDIRVEDGRVEAEVKAKLVELPILFPLTQIDGKPTGVESAYFYEQTVESRVRLEAGEPALLGAMSPPDKRGNPDRSRKILVFVRAVVGEEPVVEVRDGDAGEWDVDVTVEMAKVPHRELTTYLVGDSDLTDGMGIRKWVDQWIREGKAETTEKVRFQLSDGGGGGIESLRTVRYPSAYDFDYEGVLDADGGLPKAVPRAFSSPGVGPKVWVKASATSGGKGAMVGVGMRITSLVKEIPLGPEGAGDFGVRHPVFFERSLTASVYASHDAWVLAGIFGATDKEGKPDRAVRTLVFVRAKLKRKE